MKRMLASLLVLLMLLSMLAGCSDTDVPPPTTTEAAPDTTAAPESTATPTRLDELGEKNWDGRIYTILDANTYPEMHVNIPGAELTGDIVNDALFNRERRVEERYGVELRYDQRKVEPGITALRNGVLTNDTSYNLCISLLLGGGLANLAIDGTLMNLTDIPYLSLDQTWWSPLIYENMQLGGKMYFTTGDIAPTAYQTPACLFVNTKLMADHNITTDLFALVREGKWTLDALATLTRDLSRDVNLDGVMDCDNDFFGYVHPTLDALTATMMVTTAGLKLSTLSADKNTISVELDNEHAVDVINKIRALITPDIKIEYFTDPIVKCYANDRALTMYHATESAANQLRAMVSNYLLLPMPKFDENQENYHSTVSTWAHAFVGVPKNADPEFTGFITEALAYDSHINIRPLAFDLTYKIKAVDDPESAEMLDLIFDTMYIDFNCIYDFGGVQSMLVRALRGEVSLASQMAMLNKVSRKSIEEFTEQWVAND